MSRIKKEKRRPVVVFDYDDVLFDFLGEALKEYNDIQNENIQVEDIQDWDLGKIGNLKVFRTIMKDPALWTRIPEKNGSMKILQQLINDGRWTILIATACTSLPEYTEKVKMIEKHLPGFDVSKIISITDKHLIRGDIIIDDKIDNLEKCSPYMKCILMDMPHNRKCDKFERIRDLNGIPALLEELFD